jgi:dephospho-CoA kinase
MMVFGLTGGVATGKSTVAKLLKALGVPVLDADSLAHKAINAGNEAYTRLITAFGEGILLADGKIDRRKLRGLLIGDPKAKEEIEAIVHPEVMRQSAKKIQDFQEKGAKWTLFEVPLLFESGLEKGLSPTIVVYCPSSLQLERLLSRDKMGKDEAIRFIGMQWDIETKRRLADYVIDNQGSLEDLKKQTLSLHKELRERFGDPW